MMFGIKNIDGLDSGSFQILSGLNSGSVQILSGPNSGSFWILSGLYSWTLLYVLGECIFTRAFEILKTFCHTAKEPVWTFVESC